MSLFQKSVQKIMVTRSVDTNATVETSSTKDLPPIKPCCYGVWIEAVILIVIVIAAVIGFYHSVKNFK